MRHALRILVGLVIERVFIRNPLLHRRALRDPVDPRQQMRELLHLLLGHAAELPALDPRPGPNVRDAVLALAGAGEVLARLARVVPAQVQLEHAVDADGLVAEAVDGVGDLVLCELAEVVELAWGTLVN